MKLFSYVIEHDLGFAPNPFHGFCSLAACKPRIRSCAQVGNYVVGTGCAKKKRKDSVERRGYLVYFMKVTEVLTFDEYWNDPRFVLKRPLLTGSTMQNFGDNIYHRNSNSGDWVQEDSFHSLHRGVVNTLNLEQDTGITERVLLSSDFAYWGGQGPQIPNDFRDYNGKDIVCAGRHHRSEFADDHVEAFIKWLRSLNVSGWNGVPLDWNRVSRKPMLSA